MLICLEGTDGCGKSTQAKLLTGFTVVAFPRYDHFFGKIIKLILNQKWGKKISPYLVAWLFATDRLLAKPGIEQLLNSGKNVVIDRYTGSSQAHQGAKLKGAARQKIIRWIDWLEKKIYRLPQPDKTFWLNLPIAISRTLINQRARGIDEAEKDLHHQQEAYTIYQQLAKEKKWIIINCTQKGKLKKAEAIRADIRSGLS